MPQLTLYYKPSCSYCQRVFSFMRTKNITLPLKDVVSDSKNYEELIKIGGKGQTPCLVIDGKALYESRDIINWLEANYKK